MIRPRITSAALALAVGAASPARADSPKLLPGDQAAPFPLLNDDSPCPEPEQSRAPGYFNGIGSMQRSWELQTDTALDTHRIFTQRFELTHAFSVQKHVDVVLRVSFGGDDASRTGVYAIQGPIASLGVRDRAKSGDYWVEAGLRLILPWDGPNSSSPEALQLALGATLASGLADDARWLSFADVGGQVYGAFQSRTSPFQLFEGLPPIVLGAHYGGQASIAPMKVRSWIGPQTGFIGNAFLELFLTLPKVGTHALNTQIGGHGDVSLSTIWPGDQSFPAAGNVFIGWSPEFWFSMRVFAGVARSLNTPPPSAGGASYPYGLRLELFMP